jgi:ubiquinone/menaquinone biosynthesis C-methylase UbiE
MASNYTTVTEAPGQRASREQLAMLYTRYAFAAEFCHDKHVLEIACGSGQGLGYLAKKARKLIGGDYTENLLKGAHQHYRGRVPLLRLDAHALPFRDSSFDVVLLYEAIYYLANPEHFLDECRRVLLEKGMLLLCTANKEWSDFNPSPFSTRYFSARELSELLRKHGFRVELQGAFPVKKDSANNHMVSFLKRLAVALHLIPRTMKGKEILKWLFLGRLSPLPSEVNEGMDGYAAPVAISDTEACTRFKIIFALAHLA